MTVERYGGSSWRVEATKILDRQEICGKAELATACAPHIANIFYWFSPKKRAYYIMGLLREVRASIPKPMKLYVILDNHHAHTSDVMKRFVRRMVSRSLSLRLRTHRGGT